MSYDKPLPVMDPDFAPFWQSCHEHKAALQRCSNCQKFRFPPRLTCPHCGSSESEWTPIAGRGTVYTAITVVQPFGKAWESDVPYNGSVVELEEGVRLWTNVIDCPPDEVVIGMPVEIVYDDVTAEVTLPKFRPR